MTRQTTQLAHRVNSFVSSSLDVNASRSGVQQTDDVVFHGRLERCDLWSFEDQCHVKVSNFVPVFLHCFVGVLHKLTAITTPPTRVRILENLANIRQRQSTKDCIHYGMIYHVTVAMGDYTEFRLVYITRLGGVLAFGIDPLLWFVINHDTPNNNRLARFFERSHTMNIKAVTDTHRDLLHLVGRTEQIIRLSRCCREELRSVGTTLMGTNHKGLGSTCPEGKQS
mmetsp:Transcript_12573/g.24145  ORF Transcript_12573/g.24145 Transcript_12573/m.24145 type:complete len:225 (+) Transcript_12573:31-705(+)